MAEYTAALREVIGDIRIAAANLSNDRVDARNDSDTEAMDLDDAIRRFLNRLDELVRDNKEIL